MTMNAIPHDHALREMREQLATLQASLMLSVVMTESDSEAKILELAATSVPSISPCRMEGVHLGGAWQPEFTQLPAGGARLDVERQLDALGPNGGAVAVPGRAWGWGLPLRSLRTPLGYCVVAAAEEPSQMAQFLLRVLVQQAGASLANVRLHSSERATAKKLSSANVALDDVEAALRRSMRIHDCLTRAAATGEGVEGIARAVHDLTGYPIAIEDRHGNLRAWAGPRRPDTYPRSPRSRRLQLLHRLLRAGRPIREGERLIAAASPGAGVLGLLILVDPEGQAGDWDKIALEHGATVLSMELAQRTPSLALQRSLLPQDLAGGTAVEAASRYVATGATLGVGGDWFDVIPLSGARVALVVGDVVGHGIDAAATMGQMRTAVRTLADLDVPPDELLAHLDDLVISLVEQGNELKAEVDGATGARCLYAVYDPVTRRCAMARAGHLPPVLVHPDGTVAVLELPAGPPLGLGALPFESAEFELPEGAVIALYTDGLVQCGGRDIDDGISQLRDALTLPSPTLDALCGAAVETLLEDPVSDDAVLLLARTRVLGENQVASWSLAGDPSAVANARDLARAQLSAWGLGELEFTTELVVSELVTNAIRYGTEPICLRLIREDVLICEVSDGSSTSPRLRHARTMDEGGRGLFLVAQLTRRWGTRYTTTGKIIWTEQNLPSGDGAVGGTLE
jgi:anti-sigma regulatory factor (Ser/Thr protein kinase)